VGRLVAEARLVTEARLALAFAISTMLGWTRTIMAIAIAGQWFDGHVRPWASLLHAITALVGARSAVRLAKGATFIA